MSFCNVPDLHSFITGTDPNIKEPGHANQDIDQPLTSQKLNALSIMFY